MIAQNSSRKQNGGKHNKNMISADYTMNVAASQQNSSQLQGLVKTSMNANQATASRNYINQTE
jgi:hypothetical protein